MSGPAGHKPVQPEGPGDEIPEGRQTRRPGRPEIAGPEAPGPSGSRASGSRAGRSRDGRSQTGWPRPDIPRGVWAKRPLSRRALLARLAMGSAAAGAAAALGVVVVDEATREGHPERVSRLPGDLAVPDLPSVATTATQGAAQVFMSRPDLRPPTISVDVRPARFGPDLVLTDSHSGPAQQGPMIIDANGDLVWFLPLSPGSDPGLRAFNLQSWSYRGKKVLSWFQGAVVEAHGQGSYELYDSSYQKIAEVSAKNGFQGDLHEFVITPEGTALFTCYGQAHADLSRYGGPREGTYFFGVVQEVDLKTGKLVFEWRSDDHVALEESCQRPQPDGTWDYFHINSIDVDQADGNLIISGRNTWAFYKVERAGGKVLWRLGGKASDFNVGPGAQFAFQHHVRRHADTTITLFDNEGARPRKHPGRAASCSPSTRSPARPASCASTCTLRRCCRRRSGACRTCWTGTGSSAGANQAISLSTTPPANRSSTLDWRRGPSPTELSNSPGWASRPSRRPSPSTPADPRRRCTPAGTVRPRRRVGWSWAARAVLTLAVWAAPRRGFETAITVPHPPKYLAVEAVGGSGAVLGRSETKQLG